MLRDEIVLEPRFVPAGAFCAARAESPALSTRIRDVPAVPNFGPVADLTGKTPAILSTRVSNRQPPVDQSRETGLNCCCSRLNQRNQRRLFEQVQNVPVGHPQLIHGASTGTPGTALIGIRSGRSPQPINIGLLSSVPASKYDVSTGWGKL